MQENSYDFQVGLKYQLYNSIFLTLHFATIKQTGIELPIFREYISTGLRQGKSPSEIIDQYFLEHKEYENEEQRHALLFRFIQYVERQVVLIDALEEAAFNKLNDLDGPGSLHQFAKKVRRTGKMNQLCEKINDFRVKIVLTAHPTQFYPGYVLGIINDLSDGIRSNDLHRIQGLLEQLGQTPFFKKEKPTPFDEATSLGWYLENIFYEALPKVVSRVIGELDAEYQDIFRNYRLLEVGFWPGGDRDGNPFVSTDTTLQVARRLQFILYKSYYKDVRELKRRLTFRRILEKVDELENDLRQALYENSPSTGFDLENFQRSLDDLIDVVKRDHNGFYVERMESLLLKTRIFGKHFSSLDIRQDSRVIDRAFKTWHGEDAASLDLKDFLELGDSATQSQSEDPVIMDTLHVFKTIRQIQIENGELGCHRFIISNCRRAESVMKIYAMAKNLGIPGMTLDIVPLFETIEDLGNCHNELGRLYSLYGYWSHLQKRNNRQYVMLGFSDGTKDGGYFSANWSIFKAKQRITEVSRKHDIEVVFFDGRGGPPARGGGNVRKYYASQGEKIEDREIQLTIQGQTVSSRFSSVDAACYYLENLVTAGLEDDIFPSEHTTGQQQEMQMQELADISLKKYTELKTRPDFMPYLEHRSPLTYFGKTNIGSRPSKRGKSTQLTLDDLRAIPFVGSWSAMKQNVPGYYGLGHALKTMTDLHGEAALQQLFKENDFFESLVSNSMQSLSKTRMELTRYLENDKEYKELWQNVYNENRLTAEMIGNLLGGQQWEDVLASSDSIDLRERIVLPLLIIQQYALMQLEADSSKKDVYEKLIIRTLYGIINAARNSA